MKTEAIEFLKDLLVVLLLGGTLGTIIGKGISTPHIASTNPSFATGPIHLDCVPR
jgi:hypothetical protein